MGGFRQRRIVAMISVQTILLVVASIQTSLLVRSSFGDAFLISKQQSAPRKNVIGNNYEIKRTFDVFWHENAATISSTTATFVFSRLQETSTSSSSAKKLSRKRLRDSTDNVDSTRGYCPRCKRPNIVCICHSLPDEPIDCGTRILILQHPREAKKRKRTSTVPLIGLSLKNVAICVGTTFGKGSHPLLDEALAMDQDNGLAVLLYPSDRAVPLQDYLQEIESNQATLQQTPNATSSNTILVVVDGTWAQTQTMVQNSPTLLHELPSVMFDDKTHSLFDSLRQEPAEHCTSTLEAVARAIRLFGTPSGELAADALQSSLRAMVDGQLRFANDQELAKPRYYRKEETPPVVSKRQAGRTRKLVSKKLQASVSLPKAKTAEEIELDRIRFVYIAHMG